MKLTTQEIMYINALDSMTKVHAKDCFVDDDGIVFIVDEKDIGAVIGKNGLTIKKVKSKLKKNVDVIPYAEDVTSFVRKVFFDMKLGDIEEKEENGRKVLHLQAGPENKLKILNNSNRFKRIKQIVKINYGIENIKLR